MKQVAQPWVRRAAAAAVLAVAVGATWWAARATLSPAVPTEPATHGEALVATVQEGEVGRTLNIGISINRPTEVLAQNHLAGTVTSSTDAGLREDGAQVYAVDMVPVIVTQGDIPFYRPLAEGATGDDVAQLQALLHKQGYLEQAPSGEFGRTTTEAVKRWQVAQGRQATGTVLLGELIAVPLLPMHMEVGADIRRGAILSGGEDAVVGTTGQAVFSAGLMPEQVARIPAGASITVTYQEWSWPATISGTAPDEGGTTVVTFAAPDGGSVCADQCAVLPSDASVPAGAVVELVAPVAGPAVPLAAVRTGVDGGTYVVLEDGSRAPVRVLGASEGIAVIDGVETGQRVLIDRAGDVARPTPGTASGTSTP